MKTIDPLWAAEFRGLFWADGNFMIDIYERKINGCITFATTCRCRIIARNDNREMLENILGMLGGHIYNHKSFRSWSHNGVEYTHNPCLVWQVQSRDGVSDVLDILEDCVIPNKKALEIPVMREMLRLMASRRYKYTPEMRQSIRETQQKLFSMRKYDVGKVQSSG